MGMSDFNPRSREGSDEKIDAEIARLHEISIHAPAKGATTKCPDDRGRETISIHAPAKGATKFIRRVYSFRKISIHAPAKGATKKTLPQVGIGRFQSTLPRRERRVSGRSVCHFCDFNPRSREGSDDR